MLRAEWGAVVPSDPRHIIWHTLPSQLCPSLLFPLGLVPNPRHSFCLWDPNFSYLLTNGPLNLDPALPSSSSYRIWPRLISKCSIKILTQ